MILGGNGPPDALRLPHRPILLEGLSALDGRCIGSGRRVDVVGASVGGNGAFVRSSAAGVIRAVGLDNVVLDQRGGGPAVNAQITVSAGVEGARVLDRPGWLDGKYRMEGWVQSTWRFRGSSLCRQQSCRRWTTRRSIRRRARCCRLLSRRRRSKRSSSSRCWCRCRGRRSGWTVRLWLGRRKCRLQHRQGG